MMIKERYKKHVHKTEIILQGWFGHKKPFNFEFKYSPYQGIEKYLTGTPSIISMKQLEASLNIYSKLNIVKLRKKSFSQTSLLIELISKHYETSNIKVISPGGSCRGGHVAITHPNAAKLIKAYENNGLLGDYRPPNVIRFGISPIYNSYNDIWNAASPLHSSTSVPSSSARERRRRRPPSGKSDRDGTGTEAPEA